jgi:hypothetical protein
MGFENFATNEPTAQEAEHLNEHDDNVRRIAALMKDHGGDAEEVRKIVLGWVDEAKKRYDAKP